MVKLPTLIILAGFNGQPALSSHGTALQAFFQKLLDSDLPTLLVAPHALARLARTLLPGDDVLEFTPRTEPPEGQTVREGDLQAQALAAGVEATSRAPGWLVLPADEGVRPLSATLRTLARALRHYPLVHPQFGLLNGQPVGYGAELFSELIRLDGQRSVQRLNARYPAMAIAVDDPGILSTRPPDEFAKPRAHEGRTPRPPRGHARSIALS